MSVLRLCFLCCFALTCCPAAEQPLDLPAFDAAVSLASPLAAETANAQQTAAAVAAMREHPAIASMLALEAELAAAADGLTEHGTELDSQTLPLIEVLSSAWWQQRAIATGAPFVAIILRPGEAGEGWAWNLNDLTHLPDDDYRQRVVELAARRFDFEPDAADVSFVENDPFAAPDADVVTWLEAGGRVELVLALADRALIVDPAAVEALTAAVVVHAHYTSTFDRQVSVDYQAAAVSEIVADLAAIGEFNYSLPDRADELQLALRIQNLALSDVLASLAETAGLTMQRSRNPFGESAYAATLADLFRAPGRGHAGLLPGLGGAFAGSDNGFLRRLEWIGRHSQYPPVMVTFAVAAE